jgi:hypothetical protein
MPLYRVKVTRVCFVEFVHEAFAYSEEAAIELVKKDEAGDTEVDREIGEPLNEDKTYTVELVQPEPPMKVEGFKTVEELTERIRELNEHTMPPEDYGDSEGPDHWLSAE